jgi:hypothetical protein
MATLLEILQKLDFDYRTPSGALALVGVIAVAAGSALGGVPRLTLIPCGLAPIIYAIVRPFRLPRAHRGKFGVVFAMACETSEEFRRVWADFGFRFCELARSGIAGRDIQLLRLSPYWSDRVLSTEDAKAALVRMRAKYMLSCRVRRRSIRGKQTWFLELRGMVAHRPIAGHDKRVLEREFSELLPRGVPVDVEEDLPQFELEAQRTEIVSRYILGIATYLSGDLERAERLYQDVGKELPTCPTWDAGTRIVQRLPMRFAEIAIARAGRAYNVWLKSSSADAAAVMKTQLEAVPALAHTREDYIALRALQLVVTERDASAALAVYETSKQKGTLGWRLGCAFLRAYRGELRAAARIYREAGRMSADPEPQILLEVEEFLYWFQRQPEGSAVASYCLGCLNMHVKHDAASAIAEFQRFLTDPHAGIDAAERRRVASWVADAEVRLAKSEGQRG